MLGLELITRMVSFVGISRNQDAHDDAHAANGSCVYHVASPFFKGEPMRLAKPRWFLHKLVCRKAYTLVRGLKQDNVVRVSEGGIRGMQGHESSLLASNAGNG